MERKQRLLMANGEGTPLVPEPSFYAPFNDAGAGVVNAALARGTGSPTFVRATTAWTKLSSGLWASVASGSPRSCYIGADTAVGTYGGFFSEGAGTQLVTPTASIRGMDDASWVKVNVTATKTATGIDGSANSASRVTATSNGGTILQTLVAAASTRIYHAFIRRVTGTGTITLQAGAGATNEVSASLNTSTYTRVSVSGSVLNAAFGIAFGTSGDAIDVDFNQFEAGSKPTSPMAAAGAARNADDLSYTLAGNVSNTLGALYAECYLFPPLVAAEQRSFYGSSTGSGVGIYVFGTNDRILINDGTNTVSANGSIGLTTGVRKVATSWGNGLTAVNAAVGPVGAGSFDGSMSFTGAVVVGNNDATNHAYGTIKNLAGWQLPVSNQQLFHATR